MSYPRGQMDKRIKVYAPVSVVGDYGKIVEKYTHVGSFWAWVTWTKGARALNHGYVDVYNTLMVRLDAHACLNSRIRLEISGQYYLVESIHKSEEKNECQIVAVEVENILKAEEEE